MAITRLSGGTTPANGSDPRTFPTIWNAAADDIEAAEAAIAAIEAWDLDDINDVVITSAVDGEVLTYDSGNWINQTAPENTGFTASTTITATDATWSVPTLAYPIVKVTAIGGGGGGGFLGSNGNNGGTTTFNAGGAGTVTATGGTGGVRGTTNSVQGFAGTAGSASANGGQGATSITDGAPMPGNGGQLVVSYLDLTGISTVNITIGAGGAGGSGGNNPGAGGRGEVIVEYVAG